MTRLWVPPASLSAGPLRLGGADYRYLARVHRLRAGDALVLFDGEGREAAARVLAVDEAAGEITVELQPPARPEREPRRLPLTLLVALLKGEKMDLVVQKATELGVTRIAPVAAARSVVRLEVGRAAGRVERWRKIALEAARQCGRSDAPAIAAPASLAVALAASETAEARLLFHEGARAVPLGSAWPVGRRPASVALAVGPEGGFTPEEVESAREAGFTPVGLGPRVLRAETAAVAAVAVIGYLLGDLGESGI